MIEIAREGEWVLYDRPEAARPGWQNLKLVRVPGSVHKIRKHCFWFGWDGTRLSRSDDARRLKEHYPEVYDWVVRVMSSR